MTATNVPAAVLQRAYEGVKKSGGTGDKMYASVHSADNGTTGANEIAGSTRVEVVLPAGAAGTGTAPVVAVPVPAGVTVKYWGLWDAPTGGNFQLGGKLPVDLAFPAAGKAELTITVSAKAATA